MNRTHIYLSQSQHDALSELAKARKSTPFALIREAIDGYLAWQLSPQQRLDALRAPGKGFAQKPQPHGDAAEFVDDLRRTGMDRLRFRAARYLDPDPDRLSSLSAQGSSARTVTD